MVSSHAKIVPAMPNTYKLHQRNYWWLPRHCRHSFSIQLLQATNVATSAINTHKMHHWHRIIVYFEVNLFALLFVFHYCRSFHGSNRSSEPGHLSQNIEELRLAFLRDWTKPIIIVIVNTIMGTSIVNVVFKLSIFYIQTKKCVCVTLVGWLQVQWLEEPE